MVESPCSARREWHPGGMRPKRGIQLESAVRQLRELATTGRNLQSGGPLDLGYLQNLFLQWVHDVERVLSALFTGSRLETLHTERFWRIHSMTTGTVRPFELISDEVDVQAARIEALAAVLQEEGRRLASASSTIAVPDTNALLHYRLFDEIPWPDVVGSPQVRLAIPLRVVDELDAKKASRRPDLARRAATILAHLEQRVGTAMEALVQLRDGVTVEIARAGDLGEEPYQHPSDADTEILDTCDSLAFFSGEPVRLLSGDYGMRLRAASRNLDARKMPEELRLAAAPQES